MVDVLVLVWIAKAALPAQETPPPRDDTAGLPLVRSLSFEGRETIDLEAIERAAGVRAGDPWPPNAAVYTFTRLVAWPPLESVQPPRVSVNPDGTVDVVFSVKEAPRLAGVSFAGNEVLDSAALAAVTGLERGEVFRRESIEAAAAAVLEKYHRDGFLLAEVEPETVPAGPGRLEVLFRIVERRRVYVRSVKLEGARESSGAEALSVLQLQPRRLFGIISKGYYVPENIEADLQLLRKFYRSRGFLDVVVSFGGMELNPSRTSAEITLRVEEGPAFTLEGVRVEGQKLFPSGLLEREAHLSTGGRFTGEDVDAGLRRLIRWYEEHADIAPKIGVRLEYGESEAVTAVYTVFEEEHYVTGRVRIDGNRMTRDRVVRSDVTLIPGTPFTRMELDRTLKRLEKRGLYESVEMSEEAGEAPGTRDVTLTVMEREHMGFFEVGGGGSSGAGGVAYAAIRHSNLDLFRLPVSWTDWRGAFVGGGQKLEVEIIPGSRESEYRFRFMEPYFLRSDQALMLAGGPSFFDRRTYEEDRLRGVAALEKHFDRDRTISASLAYIVESVEIRDLHEDAPPDAVAVRGETFLAYPRLELRFSDVEMNYYSGPAGLSASSRLDVAGRATGSEAAFARAAFSAEGWWPLIDRRPDFRHVFHVGVHAGWIDGIGGDDPPIFERFYLGGPRTFPGFRYRRLGPDRGGTPVGGEGILHGTVSYSFPLFWREVRAFGRFDWGDLEPSFSRIDTGRFRTAAGGGLELRLKIAGQPFPATFFWMKALSSESGDRDELFSFTIGLPF